MFNQKEKNEYLSGEKVYTKKGKQGSIIGKIVKVDWDLKSEKDYISDVGLVNIHTADKSIREWILSNDVFIITDFHNWGLSSTVTLDHRFEVSGYRTYDPSTNRYIYQYGDINGDGIMINNR
jgi:hypothetical protein